MDQSGPAQKCGSHEGLGSAHPEPEKGNPSLLLAAELVEASNHKQRPHQTKLPSHCPSTGSGRTDLFRASLAAVPVAVRLCCGRRRALSRLPAIGETLRLRIATDVRRRDRLRRGALHARSVARARMRLWGRCDRRCRRPAHGAVDFGARFAASSGGGIGGDGASPVGAGGALSVRPARIRASIHAGRVRTRMGAVHVRPIQRAVAGCRGERTLPAKIAPLAGGRGAAESLLQGLGVIRHAPAVRGIVLPCDRRGSRGRRPVDAPLAIHGDVGDVDDGDVALAPVAGAEEKSRAHGDADTPGESRRISGIRVIAGPGRPVDGGYAGHHHDP